MTHLAQPVVVLDASALVALLTDSGEIGDWVAESMANTMLAGPHLVLIETANVLRRRQLRGELDASTATLAHADLLDLPLQLWPYSVLADRVWQLRESITAYDGTYVALAELLGGSLVTLDQRLARAHGPRCRIRIPPT